MSNLIKSVYFNIDREKKVIIDSNEQISNMEVFQKEEPQMPEDFEFVPGINVLNIDEIIEQERESMVENVDSLIEEAKAEAESILAKAREEAQAIFAQARENGYNQGYNEGTSKAEEEINLVKQEYEDKCNALQGQFDAMVEQAEPQIVELICDIVERLTGIVVNDKSDAITYIIERSLKELPPSDTYILHVSPENLSAVMEVRDALVECVKHDAVFDIEEDTTLLPNQCIIETDTHIIDCSLDVQLDNLKQELCLISTL